MATDQIQHAIVLMLENRSFDHVLGDCPKAKAAQPLTGLNTYKGSPYPQAPGAARLVPDDPKHETSDVVMVQLAASEGVAANGGFVLDYSNAYHDLTDAGRAEVMKFHAFQTLPAMHALAQEFTVCDRWFASVPGPTWANRLFALSGTSLGRVKMPDGVMNLNLHWYDQPTIFDRLNEKSVSWKVYFGDTPLSLLFVHQWEPQNASRHRPMTEFFADAAGDPGKFPAFAFIEPAYLPPGANDGHPPHDILDADALVASVYNAVRANDALWRSTLLVVLFDEHGGF
jgi:phospholipase C